MSGSGSHRTGQRQRRRACIDTGHIWWPTDRQWNRCESCGALDQQPSGVTKPPPSTTDSEKNNSILNSGDD